MNQEYHSPNQKYHSPLTKDFEIQDFDETFEENSLKKFFQKHDLGKENGSDGHPSTTMIDEFSSPNTDDKDLNSSPLAKVIQKLDDANHFSATKLNFDLNLDFQNEQVDQKDHKFDQEIQKEDEGQFNLSSFAKTLDKIEATPQIELDGLDSQKLPVQNLPEVDTSNLPIERTESPQLKITNMYNSMPNIDIQDEDEEAKADLKAKRKDSFEDMIRNKKIFKIKRDIRKFSGASSRSVQTSGTNSPRKMSSRDISIQNPLLFNSQKSTPLSSSPSSMRVNPPDSSRSTSRPNFNNFSIQLTRTISETGTSNVKPGSPVRRFPFIHPGEIPFVNKSVPIDPNLMKYVKAIQEKKMTAEDLMPEVTKLFKDEKFVQEAKKLTLNSMKQTSSIN